jgi:TonB family protein
MFLSPLGNDLDKLALLAVASDRFNPGIHDGTPVAVAESVEVVMQGCILQSDNQKTYSLRLRSQPVQSFAALSEHPIETVLSTESRLPNGLTDDIGPLEKVGGSVSRPVLLNNPIAEFTDAARKAKYQGTCTLSLIVDKNGMPQNIQVIKSLDYGLEQNAVNTVKKYRFKPAMKDDGPVPVQIKVVVNFKLFPR